MHPSNVLLPHHGVHVIDTGFQRPRFDAAYLVVDGGRAAFVDTGTRHGVPRLLDALDRAGLAREAVDYVVLTHVHLDHAGGAGVLMAALPQARLVVHPRGARHMIDPGALYEGARQVYGDEEMARSYGTLVGVPAERVIETHDGMTLGLGGRELSFLDTPGHARHHNCIWDAASRGVFAGDTFGLSYRELDVAGRAWLLPTTTPVQFDPEALKASVRRIMTLEPDWIYLTHFGPVGDVQRLGALMLRQVDAMVEVALRVSPEGDRHEVLKAGLAALYLRGLREHGSTASDEALLALLALDIELNAQGVGIWLDRRRPA
jgi:glyoxylase-like metal-dependent hydrolase (beta-lactamase superfamily II)